ncbi:MAG: DUF411 domain-containing protein [Rhodothermales bacterium]|nr:DUF411 domain-containing protein [Rhodothermales bacterium]
MSKPLLAGLIAVVIGAGAFVFTSTSSSQEIVVYKSPTCGCCAKWIDHIEEAGYKVQVRDTNDMQPIKMQHGIQRQAQSCHTAIVDGYFVEGHVPAEFITKLLEEKPDIKGITVPGMPQGSPGMEGPNPVDYDVIAIGKDGEASIFGRVTAGS